MYMWLCTKELTVYLYIFFFIFSFLLPFFFSLSFFVSLSQKGCINCQSKLSYTHTEYGLLTKNEIILHYISFCFFACLWNKDKIKVNKDAKKVRG